MGDQPIKHYDVGIAGVWFGGNYGSVLTYYALRKTVMGMGYTVAMIDRPGFDHYDPEVYEGNHARMFAHEQGYEVLPVPDVKNMAELNQYCDTFMVGSDQLWNYGIARGFGPSFYLGFADETKTLISYATSFGHGTSFTPKGRISAITQYLQRFDSVSVRESEGVRILKEEFGVRGTQVIDPIYLLERTDFDELIDPSDTDGLPEKYLLAYVLGTASDEFFNLDEPMIDFLTRLAQEKGMPLVVLADARKQLPDAAVLSDLKRRLGTPHIYQCRNVSHWLGCIKNCDFMMTDSFHGAGFGLIYERQLLILGNQSRGMSRFYSLGDTFGIRHVLADSIKGLRDKAADNPTVDYENVNRILAMEQERSSAWLRKALESRHVQGTTIDCIKKKECCGCMGCLNACPVDCITMVLDDEGVLYPQIDHERCIHCGKCLKVCPSENIVLDKEEFAELLAAYTAEDVRMISSSGGIFSLVAEKVIADGGVVFGAAFDDDFVLRQTSARTLEELAPLRYSKYIQSQADLTYREAKEALKQGKPVLYVGCPCQIAGLNSYLGKKYDSLITIDLLCHGGPTPYSFAKYLNEVHGGKEVEYVGFRDKDHFGWSTEMTVKYREGEPYREVRGKDIFYRAFLPCLSVRPHCQVCNYSRLPRQGDITLGDFWGVSRYNEALTDGNGTSIVSLNSEAGQRAYAEILPRLAVSEPIDRDYILTHGQPYAKPFKNNPLRYRFQRLLQDVSFQKSLEACATNDFDFMILGMEAASYGAILEYYGLQRAMAEEGLSVIMSYVPRGYRQHDDTPLKYRLTDFANWFYPTVSAHESVGGLKKANEYVHGFVELARSNYSSKVCLYRTGPMNYQRSVADKGGVSPLLLLERKDWQRVIDDAVTPLPGTPYVAVYCKQEAGDLDSIAGDAHAADACADMRVGDWAALMNSAAVIVTDQQDGALVGAALERPTIYIGSDTEALSKAGVRVVAVSREQLGSCASLESLQALAEIPAISGDPARTRQLLARELRTYWHAQKPSLHKKLVKWKRRAKRVAKKILRR